MYPVASHNPTAEWGFLHSAPGQGREEHAQGDDPDAPRGGHLQAPGAAVLCAGNHDGLGFQRLQVCTSQLRKQWAALSFKRRTCGIKERPVSLALERH